METSTPITPIINSATIFFHSEDSDDIGESPMSTEFAKMLHIGEVITASQKYFPGLPEPLADGDSWVIYQKIYNYNHISLWAKPW